MNIARIRKTLLMAREKIQIHIDEIYSAGNVEYMGLGSTIDSIDDIVKEIDAAKYANDGVIE